MKKPKATRSRLLEAATEVFAEVGYEAATTRAICARAGANVALINYHFGDKFELYSEVLQECLRHAPLDAVRMALETPGPPESVLREVIGIRLRSAFEGEEMDLRLRLLFHEMAKPTPALTHIVNTVTLPIFRRGLEFIGSILGLPPDDEETRLCLRSVAGQVLFYVITGPLMTRMWPEQAHWGQDVDRIADHITDFSMAYLRESVRRRAGQKGMAP